MHTTKAVNKKFSSLEIITPFLHSSEAKVIFTAVFAKSLFFLWGNTPPFYVSMLALGIIRNWVHLMEMKKFVNERDCFRQWTWISEKPQSREEPQTAPSAPAFLPSPAVLNLLKMLEKKDPEERSLETTANVPQDLANIRNAFLEKYKPIHPA